MAIRKGNIGKCRGNTTVMLKFIVSRYERSHRSARGCAGRFQALRGGHLRSADCNNFDR
jgi:hypothetical protein